MAKKKEYKAGDKLNTLKELVDYLAEANYTETLTVKDFAGKLGISDSLISPVLLELYHAGSLTRKKQGGWYHYKKAFDKLKGGG